MTYLEGSQISAGLHIIKPRSHFNDKASYAKLAGKIPVALGSNEGGDSGGYNYVPNFYYTTEFDNGLHFGLGVNSPVGLRTSYNNDWMGRYTSTSSDLKTVNINPSLAFKVSDQFSVGAGFSAQYLKTTLKSRTALCGHPKLAPNCNPTNASEVYASDARTKMEGHDWSGGFNIGIIYQPIESTRIGISYRSRIKQNLDGDIKVKLANGFSIKDENISANLDVPDTFSVSLTHQFSTKIMLLGDITYTGWSSFDKLKVDFKDGSSDVTKENWDNAMRYSLGIKYQYSPDMILRTGIALDQTPIDNDYRTSRIPGDNRTWLSVGMSYVMTKELSFDIGYAHIWVDDAKVNEKFSELGGAIQGELIGKYKSSVDILSAQLNWNF
jgi:long-chain fatty acid transport protein